MFHLIALIVTLAAIVGAWCLYRDAIAPPR